MASELHLQKQQSMRKAQPFKLLSSSPRVLPRPLLGRDEQGRLRMFAPDMIDQMSSKPGPGGWQRVAGFDGQASSQRGLFARTTRMGPGPEQSMPHSTARAHVPSLS